MIVAIDRNSFNNVFKYNYITISESQILRLSNEILYTEGRIVSSFIISEFDRILPVFELDHEVLILEILNSKLEFNGVMRLSFESILKVYPLSERAKNLLSGKLNQSIELSEPKFQNIVELVKIDRAKKIRELLFVKLKKICCLSEFPSATFTQDVKSVVEMLLLNQVPGNSFLANLIQYNYNPNEISSGNIEFFEKIGVIAWITSQSRSDGYYTSNYYKRCEEFKININEGNYVCGFDAYQYVVENLSPDFKKSHDSLNAIINEGQFEIDLFKVSYYFLSLKTKLNKNNSNFLDLYEDVIRDIYLDEITMTYVLYLISFTFSFEQLYESIHILEKSPLLISKLNVREAEVIFEELEKERKIREAEEERISHKEEILRLEKLRIQNEALETKERIEMEITRDKSPQVDEITEEVIEVIAKEKRKEEVGVDKSQQEGMSPDLVEENLDVEEIDKSFIDPVITKDEILAGNSTEVNKLDIVMPKLNNENISEPITLFVNSAIIMDEDKNNQTSELSDVKNDEVDNHKNGILMISDVSSTTEVIGEVEAGELGNEDKSSYSEGIKSIPIHENISLKEEVKVRSKTRRSNSIPTKSSESENQQNQEPDSGAETISQNVKEDITIEIFEIDFVAANYKDDMVKFLVWDKFLRAYFEDKTEIITLSKILKQIDIVKSAKEGLLKTEEEITKIHNFFSK
jgi:hypothetical protein